MEQLRRNTLSQEEATRLAIDDWTRSDGLRLQEAVAAAIGQFAEVVDTMRAHPGEPERMAHSMTRIFSFGGPEKLKERGLYSIRETEGGRRVSSGLRAVSVMTSLTGLSSTVVAVHLGQTGGTAAQVVRLHETPYVEDHRIPIRPPPAVRRRVADDQRTRFRKRTRGTHPSTSPRRTDRAEKHRRA